MVGAAAATDGVLLEGAHPGGGLPRVQDQKLSLGQTDQLGRGRGHTGEVGQEVEGRPFPPKDRGGRSGEGEENLSPVERGSVLLEGKNLQPGVDSPVDLQEDLSTTENSVALGFDEGVAPGRGVGEEARCGDVPIDGVFVESQGDQRVCRLVYHSP